MSKASASGPSLVVDPTSIDADLQAVPLWVTTAVLWVYVVSVYVYRSWYLAAAVAVVVVAILAAAGTLRTRGFARAIVPVLAYFGIWLASACWAMYPDDTLRWVAIDSIEIAVFALGFIVGRNSTSAAITTALMTLVVPSVAIAAIMQAVDPNAPRSAQYAGALLAFLPPFAYLRALTARPRWPAVLSLVLAVVVLLVGRSRTPLATAILLLAIAVVVFRKTARLTIRDAAIFSAVLVLATGTLLLVPATRKPVVMMFVRLTHIGVVWGDLEVPAEPAENWQRVDLDAVSRALLPEAIPFGIGYGNFIRRFHNVTGYDLPIHNIYMSWLIEGGLLSLAAVSFLAWRHVRALSACIGGASTAEERVHGQLIAIASVGILTFGVYHQVHQAPAFWMLLGLGAACGVKDDGDAPYRSALFGRWQRSDPPFAPALCAPLMSTALRSLSACDRGALIVDLGCGNGFMLPVLEDCGYRALGIDADPSLLRTAAPHAVTADGSQLPLRSDVVDGLFVFSALQYMDRDRALEECRRVLRPGGRIVVVENLAGNPFARLSRAVRRMRGVRYSRSMEPRHHLRWRDRAIYELYFFDVTYEAHHIVAPLFLLSRALAVPAPPESLRSRIILAVLRVIQRLERRVLSTGWFRGAAWHVVITGRK